MGVRFFEGTLVRVGLKGNQKEDHHFRVPDAHPFVLMSSKPHIEDYPPNARHLPASLPVSHRSSLPNQTNVFSMNSSDSARVG